MANPLMGMMGGAPAANSAMGAQNNLMQAVQSIKRMMGTLQMAKNPEIALEKAARQNPMLNSVLQLTSGRNAQEVFYEECQKNGVDPNTIINALKG